MTEFKELETLETPNGEYNSFPDQTAREELKTKLSAPDGLRAGMILKAKSLQADGTVVLEGVELSKAGEYPDNPVVDGITVGGENGVRFDSEGEPSAPILALYGAQGDEPVRVSHVAPAQEDGEAVPLGQVKELIRNQDSGQNANGLSSTASALLVTILRNSVYSTDQSANITALENAFASGGNSGGEEPENPDEPIAPEVTLSSISAVYSGGSAPAGTAVSELTGIVVTAHYSDGSSAAVTGYTLSGEIAEGENTITVTYQGKTATFTVTGVEESSGGEGNIVDAWAYYEWDVGYRIFGASGKDVQNGDKFATTKEYISTENVEKIVVSAEGAGGLHQMGVFFFDEAEDIVSNVGGYISANNASYPTPVEIEIPEGAAYFRLTTMDKASLDGTSEKILKYSVYLK